MYRQLPCHQRLWDSVHKESGYYSQRGLEQKLLVWIDKSEAPTIAVDFQSCIIARSMQNQAMSKTAHRSRFEFPTRNSHTWNPTFRRDGRFVDAQCGQFAGTFEMFESMGSDGGIINLPTKITAQIGCN
jgi:hypothetical protein